MKMKPLYTVWVLWVLLAFTACNGAERDGEPAERARQSDVESRSRQTPVAAEEAPAVLFLGNSLSAGYGVQPEQAFPSLIQEKIDSLGWRFEVVNAGSSGDTSAGGLNRIEWLLDRNLAVLVLELGGNDGLRGLPTDVTRENLRQIIERTREHHPEAHILLAGMQIPPNMGSGYARRFREIFSDLAEKEDVDLIPFLLEGVGGIRALNQADGIHPTPRGHQIIAETVWNHLQPILEELQEEAAV